MKVNFLFVKEIYTSHFGSSLVTQWIFLFFFLPSLSYDDSFLVIELSNVKISTVDRQSLL